MARSVDNPFRIGGAALVLFCVALFLTSYSAKNPRVAGVGSAVVQEALSPFQTASHGAYSWFANMWSSYIALVGMRQENAELKHRVESLEAQNASLQELAHENERLRGLLGVVSSQGVRGRVVAGVIGYDASNWVKAISIDKGTADGITVGMPVVGTAGIVGQVIAAARGSSRVLLLTDHSSGIDAIIQSSRARGVVEGLGSSNCRWRFVSTGEEVKIGDRVISSGSDGVYPKGFLIGTVSAVDDGGRGLFQNIEVDPAEDFLKLESVLVLTDPPVGAP